MQLWERDVTWRDLALLVALYMPISLGRHGRLPPDADASQLPAHPIVRFVILVLGSMAVEGPAITWAGDHLKHHALADKQGDPHSPVDGLFHAHLGWLFGTEHADPRRTAAPAARTRWSCSSIGRFCCGSSSAW